MTEVFKNYANDLQLLDTPAPMKSASVKIFINDPYGGTNCDQPRDIGNASQNLSDIHFLSTPYMPVHLVPRTFTGHVR